jgi:site-specific DNA-cytosine methylase
MPLAIDLFCGLGGWTDGLLSEGYDVVGFDNERHVYGDQRYLAQLVLQDVLTLHGSQFRNAALIVASPPCQAYSYMVMPWQRAKREIRWQRWNAVSPFSPTGFRLNDLFDACFRLQREACEAAGHHIPMVVENVKGAQSWVGRAAWHYGSFYLWGDVPALMPSTRVLKGRTGKGLKVPGIKLSEVGFTVAAAQRLRAQEAGAKVGDKWFGSYAEQKSAGTISPGRLYGKRSDSRKAASAQIAKIPFELARWIAYCYH